QLGAMAGAAAVALLRLVFEDLYLRSAQMLGDGRLDLDLLQLLRLGDDFLVAEQHGAEGDLVALLGGQAVDEQRAALLDLVLLAAALYDRVGAHRSSSPLRAAADSRASGSEPLLPASAGSEATAAAR